VLPACHKCFYNVASQDRHKTLTTFQHQAPRQNYVAIFTKHTHAHLFNGPFSGTTRVSQYQKVKTDLDFTEARDNEWKWHKLGHMQVCASLQTDNHASTPPLSFFTGRMPFLPPNQQRQSTEGMNIYKTTEWKFNERMPKKMEIFINTRNSQQCKHSER